MGINASENSAGAEGPDSGPPDFDAFYEERAPDVARAVFLLTADRHRAAHVTQHAFARAWQDWNTIGTAENPAGRVRTVAADLAFGHLNRAGHRATRFARTRAVDTTEADSADDAALLKALRRMSPRRRRALVLHCVTGLDATQVAEETESTFGTGEARIAQGLAELAHRLPDTAPDEAAVTEALRRIAAAYEPGLRSAAGVRREGGLRVGLLAAVVAGAVAVLVAVALPPLLHPGHARDERELIRKAQAAASSPPGGSSPAATDSAGGAPGDASSGTPTDATSG